LIQILKIYNIRNKPDFYLIREYLYFGTMKNDHRMYTGRYLFLFLLILMTGYSVQGQRNIGLKAGIAGISFEPPDDPENFPFKISKDARFRITPELRFSYEWFISGRTLSLRLHQGIAMDRKDRFTATTGMTCHYRILQHYKSSLNAYAGLSGQYVVEEKNLTLDKGITPVPVLGAEYHFQVNKNRDLSVSIARHYQETLTLQAGFRWWIRKEIKRRVRCISCPSFD
jgi:hypothetical protein